MKESYLSQLIQEYEQIERIATKTNNSTKTSNNPLLILKEHMQKNKHIVTYENLFLINQAPYDVSIGHSPTPKKLFFYSSIPANQIFSDVSQNSLEKTIDQLNVSNSLQIRFSSLDELADMDTDAYNLVNQYAHFAKLRGLLN